MAIVKVYNIEGKEVEELKLNDAIFGIPENPDLVHQIYVSQEANQRQVLAHTKTRGERAGSGIKPWRQKGTGRARVGSVRTPVWKKGGVAFGPRSDRNYSKKINKKMNAKAIEVVLSGKVRDKQLFVLDKFELKENKTKEMAKIFQNLKLKGKILAAFSKDEKELNRYSRNIAKVKNIPVDQINVLDMMNNKYLVMSKDSVKYLEDKYSKSKEAKQA